jgi:hypothetical protein
MFLVSFGVAYVYCHHREGSFPSQYCVSPLYHTDATLTDKACLNPDVDGRAWNFFKK